MTAARRYPQVLFVLLVLVSRSGLCQVQNDDLMQRAEAEFDVGHGAEARELWKQALEKYRAAADAAGELQALDRLGTTAQLMGDVKQATLDLAAALDLARRNGNTAEADELLPKLAVAASKAGDLPHAITANRDLLARAEAAGNVVAGSRAAARLGDALLDAGQPLQAVPALRRAAALFHAVPQRADEGLAFDRLGQALLRSEQYVGAVEAYQQAAVLAHETKNVAREADALKGVGNARYQLGDYTAAAENLESAIRLARLSGRRSIEGSAQLSLGNVHYFQSKNTEAVEAYQQALEAGRALQDHDLEGEALGNLGLAYAHLHDDDRAADYFRQDIAIARERGDHLVEAQALGNLASLLLQQSKFADAIPLLERSRDLSSELNYRRGEAIALRNLGLAQLRTQQPAAAEVTLRQAIALQEALRGQTAGADSYNISIFNSQFEAYGNLQAALVAQGRPEAALEVSEAGHARALVDLLAGRTTDAPAASPGIDEIRAVARSRGATLVEFSLVQADDAIYAWVVQPDGTVVFHRIGMAVHAAELEKNGAINRIDGAMDMLVRNAQAGLHLPRAAAKPATAGAGRDDMFRLLYRMLIAPIADALPTSPDTPVVLIPQGSLFLLPFAALPDENGRTLIEAHTLLVAPSIQTLQLLNRQPALTALGDVLVAGNPAMSPVRLKPSGDDWVQPPNLPAAEREAIEVADLLHTSALIGLAASKSAVLERMPGARVIHLATHGIVDDVRGTGVPGALLLAAGNLDDGMLATPEIMKLRLNAALVVLSACNTGSGAVRSDGVVGLSRAFIAAGAQSVIVSLWYVPDQATAELMPAFYRAYLRLHNKAAALRQAMLETKVAHPDPVAWAGFVLIGDIE